MSPIVLASESPFRKSLMEQIGLTFTAKKPLVDEDQLKKELSVSVTDLPLALAQAKTESLVKNFPDSIIVGSDQVLILNHKTFNKPKSHEEVIERLTQLQGKTHELHTALSVYFNGQYYNETVIAELTMKPLRQEQIEKYARLDQAIGCAGGYKIECHGPLLFSSIKTSDHFSIIGLPLLSLTKILDEISISPL